MAYGASFTDPGGGGRTPARHRARGRGGHDAWDRRVDGTSALSRTRTRGNSSLDDVGEARADARSGRAAPHGDRRAHVGGRGSALKRWRTHRSRTMTIEEACSIFLNQELRIRNLRQGTLEGYETVFRSLSRWAGESGLSRLEDLDEANTRAWIVNWTCQSSTARQRLVQLKSLFRFAVEMGWLSRSPLAALRLPKSDSAPTRPLAMSEMKALLAAAEEYPKERALLLLMRYSGLAIGDAATLRRDALSGAELTLRRAKSGELVIVSLPQAVVSALRSIASQNPDYFWWSGRGKPVTTAKYWRARLGMIAKRAGVAKFRPHRLRDTFAVSLLAKDVLFQDVSALLGHSSIQTTERYYAPWDRRRRERLRRVVERSNRSDPLLAELRS